MMNGAPSQVDTFDYKPELEKYAGKQLPADKEYINSGGRKVGFLTPAWRPFRPGEGVRAMDRFALCLAACLLLLPAWASSPGEPMDCSDWVIVEPVSSDPRLTTMARSMTFSSSRTFPGQL